MQGACSKWIHNLGTGKRIATRMEHLYSVNCRGLAPAAMSAASLRASSSSPSRGTTPSTRPSCASRHAIFSIFRVRVMGRLGVRFTAPRRPPGPAAPLGMQFSDVVEVEVQVALQGTPLSTRPNCAARHAVSTALPSCWAVMSFTHLKPYKATVKHRRQPDPGPATHDRMRATQQDATSRIRRSNKAGLLSGCMPTAAAHTPSPPS